MMGGMIIPDFLEGWIYVPEIHSYEIARDEDCGLRIDEEGRLWNVETISRRNSPVYSFATLCDRN
jgi:hypothetical protein